MSIDVIISTDINNTLILNISIDSSIASNNEIS
jgi:hypothetical protein